MNKTPQVETSLDIVPFDFGHLRPSTSHILIYVDVGNMMGIRLHEYLKRVKRDFGLCKQLDSQGFEFSIIAKRDGISILTCNIEEEEGAGSEQYEKEVNQVLDEVRSRKSDNDVYAEAMKVIPSK